MINPGTRPSRLQLARHATGETSVDVSDVSSQAYLAAVEAERARVPAFDFEVLRAHAERLDEAPRPLIGRAPWWRRFLLLVPVLAVAAAVVLAVRPEPTSRVKGDDELGFLVPRDGKPFLGDPTARYGAGDRIQFTYRTTADRLVLLSVDGDGVVTTFYPEAGERGVEVIPGGGRVLPGSIILDDAPGPEVFLAFFGDDWGVTRARAAAEAAWAEGGTAAVIALGDEPDVAALPLERR